MQINASVLVLFLWSTAKQIDIIHHFLSSIEHAQPNQVNPNIFTVQWRNQVCQMDRSIH